MHKINLRSEFFTERETEFVTDNTHHLSATLFRYDSGVCAVRLKNSVGELVLLPFQGQQIWSAHMHGRNLTMKSMFDQPQPTQVYLANYGGFYLHCGFTAMGVPGPGDTHPLHGELPNAPYTQAHIALGEDERGHYIALGGRYQHTLAFSHNYVAEPLVKLYADSSLFNVALQVTNLKKSPMDYMYLAHINFRPIDGGRLAYSAHYTPEHVRVRRSIPTHIWTPPSYRDTLEMFATHPEKHHILDATLKFDPEVVFSIDYLADEAGWAHTLHILPDGSADYVRHRLDQLDTGIRWLCRTADQDALGMAEVATAEVEGYTAEKAKGLVKSLAAGAAWRCDIDMGVLSAAEAAKVEAVIEKCKKTRE
ncbi:MAG: DUF4432 family protein [Chloroflexota bacterium]